MRRALGVVLMALVSALAVVTPLISFVVRF